MDPHSFIARAEAQRWVGIAEKLLMGHDLVGSKTFAIRARDSDPRLEAADQILAVADTLLAAEKRVVGNNGAHQPDYYAILQLVRFVQDAEHIASQYRRLAVLLNPHQNRFPYADQAFQLVNDAWAVLSNQMRKSMYDSELDFPPPQQQMDNIGFNLEQQHHQQHHQHQHQQQQQHNFFSINHMGAGHEQELPEQPQTFQTRLQQSHQQQQLQQHNFLSQPNPVRPLPVREQEHLFHHREQEQLFQPQVQPFQVTSSSHQQSRTPSQTPQSQPPIQSPTRPQPAAQQSPFSWPQATHLSQPQQQNQQQPQLQQKQIKQEQQLQQQIKQEQMQQEQLKQQQLQEQRRQQEQHKQQQLKQEQLKQQQLQQERLKQEQLQQEQMKQQQLMQEQRRQQEEQKQQQMLQEQLRQQEEQKQQQLLLEQQKKQQLLQEQLRQQEEQKQQQILQEQMRQQEEQKQQQLLQEQRRQQEEQKQQQLLQEQQKQKQLLQEQERQQEELKQQLLKEEQQKQEQLLQEQQRQQEELKQQQLQQEQQKQEQLLQEQLRQQESAKHNAAAVSNQVNSSNGTRKEETEAEPETADENVDDSPTFWTACPYCFYMYEYPRVYAECTLCCDNCKRAFQAVRISSPPPVIEGQDAYFCCWASIPVGVRMSHLQNNNSKGTNSKWTPFSPFYDASNNAQNHLNCNAAPKENFFVNKSSGPRIYVDDITDDVLIDVSEPSDDSDFEWDSTKKQKLKRTKKGLNPGFKERVQVLALRAQDGRNGSAKNLKHGTLVQEGVKLPALAVAETNMKAVGTNPRKQSGRVAKELGKLDLNVEFNNNEGEEPAPRNRGHGHGNGEGEEDNVGFFEGLDEFLSSLPILSVVNEEKVKA